MKSADNVAASATNPVIDDGDCRLLTEDELPPGYDPDAGFIAGESYVGYAYRKDEDIEGREPEASEG